MLENTFCHMPGIGPRTEAHLWRAGVLSWQDACDCPALPLPPCQADAVARHADESARRLADGNARHFADRLASNLHWRLFPEFRHSVAYLDIETTGLAPSPSTTATRSAGTSATRTWSSSATTSATTA